MRELNQRIRYLEMPSRFRHLPISDEGYPIPYFVPYYDGKPEFRGFDPDGVPDPLAPGNLERPGGRGIFLMRHYMSWVQYNEIGNCVVMCKARSS